ncbi:MAG: T9SS type A sorting domain-containing protein, partial [Bacteroidales bacterium]|nr:T9SS type A sorting domain-containing protein [Bacteroidales bacterium]
VYPNPVVDQLNFTLAEQAKVQVIDLSGKTVMQQEAVAGNSTLNVADLNQGIYIVYFHFADGSQAVSRFAKQ